MPLSPVLAVVRNAIGMFADFINETDVGLIGVEPGGHGIETGEHGAPLKHGRVGIYFGMKAPMMQTEDGQIEESYSISAGLDFPSVGPQHAYLNSTGRADYVSITDDEASKPLKRFACMKDHPGAGILPRPGPCAENDARKSGKRAATGG